MYRPASSRSLLRSARSSAGRWTQQQPRQSRFLTTAPPHKTSRSWKNSALRWGIAAAGLYYYNTSNVFAEEPAYPITTRPDPEDSSATLPTLDTLSPSSRDKQRSVVSAIADDEPLSTTMPKSTTSSGPSPSTPSPSDPSALEEEASSEGAFNPETGEINWECPCLGGMAHGPCGENFREAFSCFVFSTEDPKGMDCIDRFKGMQECFREHPDVYGSELMDDDDEDEELVSEIRQKEEEAKAKMGGSAAGGDDAGRRLLEEAPSAKVAKPLFGGSQDPPSQSSIVRSSESSAHESRPDEKRSPLAGPKPSEPPKKDAAPTFSPQERQQHHEAEAEKRKAEPPASSASSPPPSDARRQQRRPEVFDEDNDLVPKAWHDTRDAKPKEEDKK